MSAFRTLIREEIKKVLSEKKEPRSEVDQKALYKYVKGDKSVRSSLISSKGKKLALGDFMAVERPTPDVMENLAKALKEFDIEVYDESWANIIEHPVQIAQLNRWFINTKFIKPEELKKMPDFQSTLKRNIKMDPDTWNQEIYNKVGAKEKIDGAALAGLIGLLSN